jgi:hypothetical protein
MTETVNKKWTDETVATLVAGVGTERPVSAAIVESLATAIGTSVRSVAAKLRQMDYEVASMAKEKVPTFNAEQSDELKAFVTENSGTFTYKEIAEHFAQGAFSAKQVQGKLLAMELTSHVKPAEKVEAARTYTEAEEVKFLAMALGGSFIEDIAAALGKEIASVRGKALSLTRSGKLEKIPSQKESHAKDNVDPVVALGDALSKMTVADIAKAVDKTERGVRTLLTRRGIKVVDYDGAAKKEKALANKAATVTA